MVLESTCLIRVFEIEDLAIIAYFDQLWDHLKLTPGEQYSIVNYPDVDRVFTPFRLLSRIDLTNITVLVSSQ